MKTIYDFSVKNTLWQEISLKDFEWKVVLIVNTATKCWLSPQFDWLEKLWQKYKEKDFVILGFPFNGFADQNPETDETIVETCKLNFWVTFPLFAKIEVNWENENPLYTFLKSEKTEDESHHLLKDLLLKLATNRNYKPSWSDIKWNFTKFLIWKNWQVLHRFAPTMTAEEIEEEIEKLLK